MMIKKLCIPALLVTCFLLITACSHMMSQEASLPTAHPEALPTGRPTCSECHEGQVKGALKPYASFNHTDQFVKSHKFAAGKDEMICAVCHASSFCVDCHANKTEIKPSVKLGNRPDRELIHRGDFVIRHRIEGKMNPASCYPCHGRANNEQCIVCHK